MIPIYDVLLEVGFRPNTEVISDEPGGVTMNLGRGFLLDAVHCISDRTFDREVLLTGVYSESRTVIEIEQWLPEFVESREAGLAYLADAFDTAMGRYFVTPTPQWWIEEGRNHRLLVPRWASIAEYEARPRCFVDSKWMSVLVQELREWLPNAPHEEHARVWFDGHTVFVQIGERRLPAAGTGRAWPNAFDIAVSDIIDNLPARRRPNSNWFEINKDSLYLGRHRLGSVSVVPLEPQS